jgi:hypothetical protein
MKITAIEGFQDIFDEARIKIASIWEELFIQSIAEKQDKYGPDTDITMEQLKKLNQMARR